jgi:phenylalanyl-tRNA synthetase alpha chain
MQEKMNCIRNNVKLALNDISDRKSLYELKVVYLGKSGEITGLLKGMRNLSVEERPLAGKYINALREEVELLFQTKEVDLKKIELDSKFEKEAIDVTLPGQKIEYGTLHPINIIKNNIIDIFSGMGFNIFEGPEIELDFYSFQALNIPKDHPARDMQDTFYITNNILLRPHTSPGQIRIMEKQKPPIKILCPGRVYRSDDDATHSPMFHQIEGLVVDKNITLCDLKGMLDEFAKKMFGESTKTRLRPSYFPFTEPSVEIDVTCSECHGKGCRLCKGTGWIEILGAGMVNRKVFENCGINPDEYTGFAFGMGLDRIAMIKYGIPDMRLLFENDQRFLKQFR